MLMVTTGKILKGDEEGFEKGQTHAMILGQYLAYNYSAPQERDYYGEEVEEEEDDSQVWVHKGSSSNYYHVLVLLLLVLDLGVFTIGP